MYKGQGEGFQKGAEPCCPVKGGGCISEVPFNTHVDVSLHCTNSMP